MTHPLLRKLAALADEDGLEDITQLLGAPGRSTLTSKLPPRPFEAAPIVINVADAESARALGDSLLVTARAKFERAAMGPVDDSGAPLDELAAAPAAPAPATRPGARKLTPAKSARPVDKARLQAKHKAGFGAAATMQRRPDGKVKLERGADAPAFTAAHPAGATRGFIASPAGERAFKAAAAEPAKLQGLTEDPFAMHLIPARPSAGSAVAATAPATAADLPGFERAPGFGPAAAANPSVGADPGATPQAPSAHAVADEAAAAAGWPAFDDLFERVDFGGGGAGEAAGVEEEAPEVEAEEPAPAYQAASPVTPGQASRAKARTLEASDEAPRMRVARPGRGSEFHAAKDDSTDRASFRAARPDHAPDFRAAKPDHAPDVPRRQARPIAPASARPSPTTRRASAPPDPTTRRQLRAAKPDDAPSFRAAEPDHPPDAPRRQARTEPAASDCRAAKPDQSAELRAAVPRRCA